VQRWLQEPYFRQAPPKSTGREQLGITDLERRLQELKQSGSEDAADALATLTAFTAAVVAQDLQRGPAVVELLVAGGGANNRTLMNQLQQRCTGLRVRPLAELGIGSSDREALAFALLAWWHALGISGSLPAVTGAPRRSVLGVRVEPPGRRSTSTTKLMRRALAFIG
jgi:anhydro-N-acetylmuramic acid kinase